MAKVVKYNGGTESWKGCTEPNELVVGETYEVCREEVSTWQTNYYLKGIEGYFNSLWFDIVETPFIPTLMAVSHNMPIIGKTYNCQTMSIVGNNLNLSPCQTNIVKEVDSIGKNVYCVTTENSIYVVQVG